ncbi:MAG TPA: M23 family metallopeptidase [Beijerinckiaceae bacterium]|nr:M23 family metallopeptidase [Beijerinckiaceae bacterium]
MRQSRPQARPSHSHFEIVLSHRNRQRSLRLRPGAFYVLIGLAPFLALVYLAISLYLVFHDDMLAALMSRTSAQQYAYEDQLSTLRGEISQMTRARSIDQTNYENKLRDLMQRQSQIEARAAAISTLADRAGLGNETNAQTKIAKTQRPTDAASAASISRTADTALAPLLAIPGSRPFAAPAAAAAYAPITTPQSPDTPAAPPAGDAKPQPLGIELRSDNADWTKPPSADDPATMADAAPVELRLGAVSASLDKIEDGQMRDIVALGSAAQKNAAKLRGALAEAGLESNHLRTPPNARASDGMGGPFIPLPLDAGNSPIDRAVLELQDNLLGTDHLKQILPYVPLRSPVAGPIQVTSPFGTRIDPFFGRLALHPGVDLRQAYGSAVYATAAGKVTIAAPDGGYGNLVEIDHGNGLATRYGHLSAFAVSEGETVAAGQEIGRIGTTGRSTGPHLHYEVRIDGEPVDPMRFLKAGEKLASSE